MDLPNALNQIYEELEAKIIDDNSENDTVEMVLQIISKKRFSLMNLNLNVGALSAFAATFGVSMLVTRSPLNT